MTLPLTLLEGGKVRYLAVGPQSHQLVGENHAAPLAEQSGRGLEEVAVAEVIFGIEVVLDDPDGPDDGATEGVTVSEVLSEPVFGVTRSVPGVNEKVYGVIGHAKSVVELDVTGDEVDGWLVLVAGSVFRVTRSVPGVNENE